MYAYQYKDHLGNIRLSYADINDNGVIEAATEILEENNYYPFGLKHQGYNDIANSCRSEEAEAYKLNGKEYEDSFGLNIYEMDLRQYDPAIGRWVVQDPITHHDYSPYSAFDNNPVYWSDPSGADATTYTLNGNLVGVSFTGQDAIDAFMQLVNGSANDYFEVAVQNTYELSTLPDDENGGDGNGNGKREGYRPTFREIHSVIANNSNFPMGVGINLFNLNMSMLTGKDRHLYGPDAIVLTKDVTGGAGVGGTVGWGVIVFMRGSLEGEAYLLGDYGVGISTVDISTGFTAQGIYYSGSISNLTPNEIQGKRWSGSFGLKELAYLGFDLSYSVSNMGFNVYGIGGSLGLSSPSPTGISFNINWGKTIIISD